MLELVALLNGFGGAASSPWASPSSCASRLRWPRPMVTLVPGYAFGAPSSSWASAPRPDRPTTLTGSVVAMLKLSGKRSPRFPCPERRQGAALSRRRGLGRHAARGPAIDLVVALTATSCLLGVAFGLIGGADMPVVISFPNSLSGVRLAPPASWSGTTP